MTPAVAPVAAAPDGRLPPDADLELIAEFIAESREALAASEAMLLELESDPHNIESVNTVFRAFHTVKGTSSFLGLSLITDFTHHAETLLARMRDGEFLCAGGYADLALRSVDTLKLLLDGADDARRGGAMTVPRDYHTLMQALADPEAAGISSGVSDETTAVPRLGDILVGFGRADRGAIEAALRSPSGQPAGLAIVQSGAASLTDVAHALRRQKHLMAERAAGASTRVRTDQLDRMLELVGALVVTQATLAGDAVAAGEAHHALARTVSQMGALVRELQELGRATRVVPLRPTLEKLARLVRDLGQKVGKQVEFSVEGADLEVDRATLDAIADPLLHMVRNAVDHGIESPEARAAAGKPPAGLLRLRASHSDGDIVVELTDDGRGLDRDRLVARATERGVISSAEGMTDREILELIFVPGLSTARAVSDLSGRGVGMDVVKRGVESLRGRITIDSAPGRGTTFSVRVPHDSGISEGTLVRVGAERYVIPRSCVAVGDLVAGERPRGDDVCVDVDGGEVVPLGDALLPVVRLHRLFDVADAIEAAAAAQLVEVCVGDWRCALLVDELLGERQVVARAPGGDAGRVEGIAGTAILGDGHVALLLDLADLEARAWRQNVAASPKSSSPSLLLRAPRSRASLS